jgi:hypothetical protein
MWLFTVLVLRQACFSCPSQIWCLLSSESVLSYHTAVAQASLLPHHIALATCNWKSQAPPQAPPQARCNLKAYVIVQSVCYCTNWLVTRPLQRQQRIIKMEHQLGYASIWHIRILIQPHLKKNKESYRCQTPSRPLPACKLALAYIWQCIN